MKQYRIWIADRDTSIRVVGDAIGHELVSVPNAQTGKIALVVRKDGEKVAVFPIEGVQGWRADDM